MAFTKGDEIHSDGFDVVAQLDFAEGDGQVLVVHNNSTHLLVIIQPTKNAVYQYFEAAYPYYKEDGLDYATAYELALNLAVELAVQR